jgi:hypothetical protein
MSYESPTYQVLVKESSFEIRQYDPFATSSVKESKLSGYSGFGYLFSYISGDNRAQQKMAMTIPVINDFADDDMTMEFVIPKAVANQVIPEPNNQIVNIKHYPAQLIATIRFSGLGTAKSWQEHQEQLQNWIKLKGYQISGKPRFARYNGPYTLPMMRRNEVHIPIAK